MGQIDSASCQGHATRAGNRLLDALPSAERRFVDALLEPVRFDVGAILLDAESTPTSVLFPVRGLVALTAPLADGSAVAVALVGRDALVGAAPWLGGATAVGRAIAQCAGEGFRLPIRALRLAPAGAGALPALARRSLLAQFAQVVQTAACNRHHALDQQVCRWLLMALDRQDGPALSMTHELIAQLLGVRREGVTAAAGKLQDAGAIACSRGRIAVHDRAALEARACECYRIARAEELRLLPPVGAPPIEEMLPLARRA